MEMPSRFRRFFTHSMARQASLIAIWIEERIFVRYKIVTAGSTQNQMMQQTEAVKPGYLDLDAGGRAGGAEQLPGA
jgi:hypothetical protein